MPEIIVHWLHLIGAAIWIGPQLLLVIALAPSLRTIPDPTLRREFTRAFVQRFNRFAWTGMVLLLLTGIFNVWFRFRSPVQIAGIPLPELSFLVTTRYGNLLLVKLLLVVGSVLVTAWHSLYIGPRLLDLPSEQEAGGEAALKALEQRLRRRSVMVSSINLLLGFAIVYLAATLRFGG